MSTPADRTRLPTTAPTTTPGTAAIADPADDAVRAQRRWVAVLLLLVALGAIGLAALGAAAERGPGPTFVGSTEQETEYQTPPTATQPEFEMPTALQENPPPERGSSAGGPLITLILIGTALLALALWVLYRMRALARPAPPLAAEAEEEDELTAAQARAALHDARQHLSTVVDAQDAVIAAWLALERAIAEAGVVRRPSRTTLEFVVEVLGSLDLGRDALSRLAHLYRRALFDPAPLAEDDRREAITLLDGLTAALTAPGGEVAR